MKPKLRTLLMILCLTLTAGAAPATEDAVEPADNPMIDFTRLVGGEWHIGPTTRFDGDTLTNKLRTFDDDGVEDYNAVWKFTDDDHYDWTLTAETAEGPKQVMESTAARKD